MYFVLCFILCVWNNVFERGCLARWVFGITLSFWVKLMCVISYWSVLWLVLVYIEWNMWIGCSLSLWRAGRMWYGEVSIFGLSYVRAELIGLFGYVVWGWCDVCSASCCVCRVVGCVWDFRCRDYGSIRGWVVWFWDGEDLFWVCVWVDRYWNCQWCFRGEVNVYFYVFGYWSVVVLEVDGYEVFVEFHDPRCVQLITYLWEFV